MLNPNLQIITDNFYKPSGFELTNLTLERESQDYGACTFELNGLQIVSRNAKVTPTKIGQFVTLWKRLNNGPIQPFDTSDHIDFVVINVSADNQLGQFVFPKKVLLEKGVFSTASKEGKRAIRVYPLWDKPTSKQALKTQQWQLDYFLAIVEGGQTDVQRAKALYLKA
ncbi:MepB family protein [Roseivirga seohaensis]|uniref:MepB family protein n=1 Tax=Roseivirga seohaensis TaxID=1914963 RepID=UPI003BAC7DE1